MKDDLLILAEAVLFLTEVVKSRTSGANPHYEDLAVQEITLYNLVLELKTDRFKEQSADIKNSKGK